MKHFVRTREFTTLCAVVAVMLVVTIINPRFISYENLMDILKYSSTLGIMAIGMLFVIITGGIDISVGSIVALVTIFAGQFMLKGWGISGSVICVFIVGIVVGGVLGLINGLLIAKLKIAPIIATLGMATIMNGFNRLYTNGEWLSNFPQRFINFSETKFFTMVTENGVYVGVPIQLIALILMAVLTHWILKYTMIGRGIMAYGNNPVSASRMGFNNDSTLLFTYIYLGLMAGVAGVVYTSALKQVDPSTFITGYELQVIAAVVIGGASIMGGSGSVVGTLLGVLLMSFIQNGLVLTRVPTFWQKIAVGLVILIAVSIDMFKTKASERRLTKVDIEA